ncbi:SMC-Scp complex subunit ScpB [Marinobacter sp. X15-166B]|uniref:SMC-Scp complex subunit ScpB n=1 Tax=Marinobacter sp. X15-166B TaxID=1897620 RepID=UPI00085C19BE|nr:SMC-Scp complex subunit ScpB [Marinobacter sp. X15-166B]OEY67406.1 SMC-Scp complex subunit ScpB [Marinobacter sp. X15-166B]
MSDNFEEVRHLQTIFEGALLAAGRPLSIDQLRALFTDDERPTRQKTLRALASLEASCAGRGFELKQVASGYRLQVREEVALWVSRLFEERPARYSRALLETLALIAYRQPITRGEIEDIRGVSVSSNIVRTLLEREWVRVVGHREVPGRPAMYATTRQFLDYFNLSSLDQLPPLSEIRNLDDIGREIERKLQTEVELELPATPAQDAGQ